MTSQLAQIDLTDLPDDIKAAMDGLHAKFPSLALDKQGASCFYYIAWKGFHESTPETIQAGYQYANTLGLVLASTEFNETNDFIKPLRASLLKCLSGFVEKEPSETLANHTCQQYINFLLNIDSATISAKTIFFRKSRNGEFLYSMEETAVTQAIILGLRHSYHKAAKENIFDGESFNKILNSIVAAKIIDEIRRIRRKPRKDTNGNTIQGTRSSFTASYQPQDSTYLLATMPAIPPHSSDFEYEDLRDHLRRIIDGSLLSKSEKAVINILFTNPSASARDISEITGFAVGSVYSYIYNARKKIAEFFPDAKSELESSYETNLMRRNSGKGL